MRGLPPPPADVVRLTQEFLYGQETYSTSVWLQAPQNAAMQQTSAHLLLEQWFTTCLPELLGCMANDCTATTCLLVGQGFTFMEFAPPNHGAWGSATAAHTFSGLIWRTLSRGRRGWAVSMLPACPADFVFDRSGLTETGYVTLQTAGLQLFLALNALPAPGGGFETVGTLHRASNGAPLGAASFEPYVGVHPQLKLGTIRRRIPSRHRLLPA